MERLTKRDADGQAMMDCEKCKADWTGKHGKPMADCTALYCRNRLLGRLVEYEDTVRTPEEVTALGELFDYALKESKTLTEQLASLNHIRELAEADKDGRVVVLPFKPGKPLLCKENILEPWLMKDPRLAVRYNCTAGIVFHMDYDTFCDLVKHDRITEVSEEAEKALQEM